MTQVFEVKKIEGKGLGWVANKDIKRGSVIFTENPHLELSLEQKGAKSMEINFNPNWVEKVMSSFNRMNKTDQDEYMKLSNSFDNIQFLIPQHRMLLQKEIENRKTVISSKEPDKNKVEGIMKILDICETNSYPQGVYITISRLNHSCRPNAMFCEGSKSFESRIRAASKINAGEEITISYVPTTVKHMNRKERQKWLLKRRQFVCRCNFCQYDAEDEKDFALYELFQRAEQLKKTTLILMFLFEFLFIGKVWTFTKDCTNLAERKIYRRLSCFITYKMDSVLDIKDFSFQTEVSKSNSRQTVKNLPKQLKNFSNFWQRMMQCTVND